MTDPRRPDRLTSKNGGEKRRPNVKRECPRCGDEFGNLALHIPSCDGGGDS